MEIKEAIKRIEDHKRIHFRKEPMAIKITEALNMSITALEKQIPKQLISEGDDESDWVHCPCCDEILGVNEGVYNSFYDNNWNPIYCHKCGQALIWK